VGVGQKGKRDSLSFLSYFETGNIYISSYLNSIIIYKMKIELLHSTTLKKNKRVRLLRTFSFLSALLYLFLNNIFNLKGNCVFLHGGGGGGAPILFKHK
jgi:hypothetical protein